MLDVFDESSLAALVGAFGGILLGLAARLGRFCTLGALEDALYGGQTTRIAMWGVAIGVAIAGTFGLIGTGLLNPGKVIYLISGTTVIASIVGGLMFGYGMALSGNCGYGALARLGGGDLRALVMLLVMGLAAYATISGPLAPLRLALFQPSPLSDIPQGLVFDLARILGTDPSQFGVVVGVFIVAGSVIMTIQEDRKIALFWGAVVGVAIVSGWAGSQWVNNYSFDAVAVTSHSFAAPVGGTILYTMTSTGSTLSFGIGSVFGVLAGSIFGSLVKGHFRWEACEDPRELRRQIAGALMMGIGAVVAMGCSVGQGLSAMSVLSYTAPITLLCIYLGAFVGLRQLIEGRVWPAE